MVVALFNCPLIAEAQARIDESFDVTEHGVHGFRVPAGTVPAMRAFDIGYRSGDAHIESLAVGPLTRAGPDSGDYIAILRDSDPGEAIAGSVRLTDVRHLGRNLVVSKEDCSGECRVRIPHLVSDEAFLLTGFDFRRRPSDSHVLQVKVRQMAHNDHIYVNLVDNSGTGTYAVYLTYAVVPRSSLGPLIHIRSEAPARGEFTRSRSPGEALLQSFDLRFLNGDHHLQRISVDLTGDRILVRFRDQDGNDPFEWMVEYSVLR